MGRVTYRLKRLGSASVTWFQLEFSSKVNTIETSIGWRMGKIALIANNETWFDYEAA